MPQLQNLVLTDRAATPVAHTFTPRSIDSGVAMVVESSGIPIGDNRVTISSTRTTAGRYKVKLQYTFPVLVNETINGVSTPKVARSAYPDISFSFDSTSTEAERNNVVGMVMDSLGTGKVLVNDTVVKLQGVY